MRATTVSYTHLRQGEAEECAQETYREVSLAQGRRCAQRRIYPEAEQGAMNIVDNIFFRFSTNTIFPSSFIFI